MKPLLLGALLLFAVGCSSPATTPAGKPVDLLLKVEWSGVITRPPYEAGFATQGRLNELNDWISEALPKWRNNKPIGAGKFNWRTGCLISAEDAAKIRELLGTPDFAAHRMSRNPEFGDSQYVITLNNGKQSATYELGLDEVALDLLAQLQHVFDDGGEKNKGACLQPVIDQLTTWHIHVKRHVIRFGLGLDVPSREWSVNELGPDFHGIAVNRGDVFVGFFVEKLPGASGSVLNNFTADLPKNAKITKTEVTTLGPLTGTGTRLTVTIPPQGGLECVLFFPTGELSGTYIATVLGGPPDKGYEDDLAIIVASIRKEHTESDNGFYTFANETEAIQNGRTVLSWVTGTSKSAVSAMWMIGHQAAFSGITATGADADLILDNGFSGANGPKIVLHVKMEPNRDVRPHATMWTAEVLGTVTAIDFDKHVISLTARPDDWRPTETW